MHPKRARRFTSISPSIGSRGGKQGRGVGRGDGGDSTKGLISLPSQKRLVSAPHKSKAEDQGDKKLTRPVTKASGKEVVVPVANEGEKDPKGLMKGQDVEDGCSSLRPKIHKQLTLLAMILELQHFTTLRKPDFIERSRLAYRRSSGRDGLVLLSAMVNCFTQISMDSTMSLCC